MLFDKPITSSTVGNVLWKGKKNKLFKKVGSGRWTKWEYIPQNE